MPRCLSLGHRNETQEIFLSVAERLGDSVIEFKDVSKALGGRVHRQSRLRHRIATHILAAEDEGRWIFVEGNYQDYEADKRKRLGEDGARPHRMRYKRW
jgi:hypothetical protein